MHARATETRRFLWAHAVLLAIVLVGFARTFYLRGLFTERPLSLALQLHGAALTLWFGLTVLQGVLVGRDLRAWHRKVAWPAIPIVIGVIASGTSVNLRLALEITSASSPENMFIWANFMSLASFAILVSAGVFYRRRFMAHHRLIFFASIAIIGPAFARFAFWPAIGLGVVAAPVFAIAGMLVLIILAIVYDLRVWRRVQPATLAGLAGVLAPLIAGTALAISGLGFRLLH